MKLESLKEIIQLCREYHCAIRLEAVETGIVAHVSAGRGHLKLETCVYLDANDKDAEGKLRKAVLLVQ